MSFWWLTDCAGGICIRERKWSRELLCVLHADGGIMLPKGSVKKWETVEQAALREFQEETGLYGCALGKKIWTIRDRMRGKKITLYAITPWSRHTHVTDEAIMWIELEKAPDMMKHTSERKFIKKYLS
jgi:8-oxo-dGTP diphosphatase